MEFKLFVEVEDDFSSNPSHIVTQKIVSQNFFLDFDTKFIPHLVSQFSNGHTTFCLVSLSSKTQFSDLYIVRTTYSYFRFH